ncbi:MAG: mannonate dehydratase [Candidatus Sumerlaeota bacterium]|nr:mannonate dehydratase [Candidatus Sumerlaeota bacterium]
MEPGLGLYARMLTRDNLRFARQIGAASLVVHMADYAPGAPRHSRFDADAKGWDVSAARGTVWSRDELRDIRRMVEDAGLRLAALENFNPALWHDVLLDGPNKRAQLDALKQTVRNAGQAGIPCIGYCFTIAGVWGHVYGDWARGAATTVGFHGEDGRAQMPIPLGWVWNRIYDPAAPAGNLPSVTREEMLARRTELLDELLPVAEEHGVRLAAHPDDPPVPVLRGTARLLTRVRDFDELTARHPSHANAVQLCVGTIAEMPGEDVYAAAEHLARTGRIAYVHLRNVRGTLPNYTEVFLDEGDVDVPRLLEALARGGFNGTVIPDHTPRVTCDAPWHAGMAWALGHLRASFAALRRTQADTMKAGSGGR